MSDFDPFGLDQEPGAPFAGRGGSAASSPPNYFQGLNDRQREAAEALDGPVLVLAGAGTGKTRVLTTRMAHLLASRRLSPYNILTVTFTNKAAREMRDRVAALIGGDAEGWWMGTFHSLAARILRRHAELVGLTGNFTILDTDDQLRLVKQILEAERIDAKKWPPRQILSQFERWKDRAVLPHKLSPKDGGKIAEGRSVALYAQYQERLTSLNACDFGDLLLHNVTIFQKHPDILAEYHQRFCYILVDEYQDTNVVQYLWLRLLAQARRNLCVVGDEDQSIYGWRGAEIGNILRFEQDFPGARVIRLEENYRSTGHILGAASGLIARNQSRLGKTLWTAAGNGELVRVRALLDGIEEAQWIGEEIETLQRRGESLGAMAILVRAGSQTREFEERFLTLGLPYRVVGGLRFYERQEIRDALAYLRVIVQPADDLAFERIINVPKRGFGPAVMQTLYQTARALRIPLHEAALRLIETDELKPKPRQTLRGLMADFARWRADAWQGEGGHTDLVRRVLDESGYSRMWLEDKSPEAPGRLENLKELVSAIAEFESLQGFLEHVSLVMDGVEAAAGAMVTLMTLHSAKGLEFDIVFLPGWEDGLFPSLRAMDENGAAALEEERRLAYVGITRARRQAYITCVARRRIYGNWVDAIPSRFLSELPADHLSYDHIPPKAWGGGGRYGGQSETVAGSGRNGWGRGVAVGAKVVDVSRRSCSFVEGNRVFHQKFGGGSVVAVDGDKLDVMFDQAGRRMVMASFVRLENSLLN
ncbi:putative DNA helicase II homolog [Azospirillaceae bacterium]